MGATNLSLPEVYVEDTPLNLADIVIADSVNATATLTLSDPAAGALTTGTSGAVTSTYDSATGIWSASGPIADVNALLAAVTFTPAENFNSTFSIATSVSDETGTATGSKPITGTPVNDAPVALNDNYTTNENTALIVLAQAFSLTTATWTAPHSPQPWRVPPRMAVCRSSPPLARSSTRLTPISTARTASPTWLLTRGSRSRQKPATSLP
jgi:Bacterial cadherin-like domain